MSNAVVLDGEKDTLLSKVTMALKDSHFPVIPTVEWALQQLLCYGSLSSSPHLTSPFYMYASC